jgi:hypothetical protein
MSGFSWSSASVPNELKSEMRPAVASGVSIVCPRQRVIRGDVVEDRLTVRCRDGRHRDRHRLCAGRDRRDRRVQRPGRVVVQHDGDRACVLRVERLVVEAAGAASDQRDLPAERARRERRAAVVRRRRGAGERDLTTPGDRHGGERAGRSVVAVQRAADRERRQRRLRVVERRDADHLVADTRGAGRPQLASVRAAVADRCDHDYPGVDEVVGRDRLRRFRPVAERRADAHVEDVGVICQRKLHRVDHHVGVRRGGRRSSDRTASDRHQDAEPAGSPDRRCRCSRRRRGRTRREPCTTGRSSRRTPAACGRARCP